LIERPHRAEGEEEGARGENMPLTGGAHVLGGVDARTRPRWARLGRFGLN
jgi:hypothetical protein